MKTIPVLKKWKKIFVVFIASFVLFFIALLNHSSFSFFIGDLFFGRIPQLYNVSIAQFFFTRSAYPLIGQPYPYAHHQLSRTFFIQGDLDKSLLEAKKELQIFPTHTNTYYIEGLTYGYMNKEVEAIQSFKEYVKHHPMTWAGRNDLAWLQFRVGDIDGALQTIAPAYELHPNNPWVLNTYGVLLMNKKDYKKAHTLLQKGYEIANKITEEVWGRAYPGNDPRIYKIGLSAMRQSFKENLELTQKQLPRN